VRLAAQLGSNLTGVTYILDEPTIGLHARDNHILVDALCELRDRGNTIIVVEHDEETIRAADTVIDLGPGAGATAAGWWPSAAWRICARAPESVTGAVLDGRRRAHQTACVPGAGRPALAIAGATANNLKNIDVRVPSTAWCA
jgi:excinuclease ABC subunit A